MIKRLNSFERLKRLNLKALRRTKEKANKQSMLTRMKGLEKKVFDPLGLVILFCGLCLTVATYVHFA